MVILPAIAYLSLIIFVIISLPVLIVVSLDACKELHDKWGFFKFLKKK